MLHIEYKNYPKCKIRCFALYLFLSTRSFVLEIMLLKLIIINNWYVDIDGIALCIIVAVRWIGLLLFNCSAYVTMYGELRMVLVSDSIVSPLALSFL